MAQSEKRLLNSFPKFSQIPLTHHASQCPGQFAHPPCSTQHPHQNGFAHAPRHMQFSHISTSCWASRTYYDISWVHTPSGSHLSICHVFALSPFPKFTRPIVIVCKRHAVGRLRETRCTPGNRLGQTTKTVLLGGSTTSDRWCPAPDTLSHARLNRVIISKPQFGSHSSRKIWINRHTLLNPFCSNRKTPLIKSENFLLNHNLHLHAIRQETYLTSVQFWIINFHLIYLQWVLV